MTTVIRRYGEPVQNRRYRLRVGAYAILLRGNQILLTHQQHPTPEFQLPGGGIDAEESVISALHREVFEETGWRIASLRRLGAFRRFTFMPEYNLWAEKLCHIYVARPARCHMQPSETGHTAVWTTPKLAVEILPDEGSRAFLRRVM